MFVLYPSAQPTKWKHAWLYVKYKHIYEISIHAHRTITYAQANDLIKEVAKAYKQDHKLADDAAAAAALFEKLNSSHKKAHGTTVRHQRAEVNMEQL